LVDKVKGVVGVVVTVDALEADHLHVPSLALVIVDVTRRYISSNIGNAVLASSRGSTARTTINIEIANSVERA